MNEKTRTEQPQEQNLQILIETVSEILQQAQFAAVNIAIAANRICKQFGRNSELGKTLGQLADQVSDATKRIEEISKVAVEGVGDYDHNLLISRQDIEPGILKKLEDAFTIIISNSNKVMNILKHLNTVEH